MATPGLSAVTILGISGSLRKASYNTMLLKAAVRLAPPGMTIGVYERLRDIPPFDADHENDMPEPARDLKARIDAADGLLIVTPEYNFGVPGVLKNAIDWASRPKGSPSLAHKPIALMGAAPSNFGTVRAQLALRQSFLWTDSDVLIKPEVIVFRAHERFDANGNLIDAETANLIRQQLVAFKEHIEDGQHAVRHREPART